MKPMRDDSWGLEPIEGVMFDLDGTLLDIDINELIRVYFSALAPVIAPILGTDEDTAMRLVGGGVKAMMTPHEGTNKEAFDAYLRDLTGVDLDDPQHDRVVAAFYRDVFPTLQGDARPMPGADAAIRACQARGLPVGIATQPIFPALATEARLRWAGLEAHDLPIVSSYENSNACKPQPEYFADMARRIGVNPSRCVMVGDDPILDMSAAQLGMRTFYVGAGVGDGADADAADAADDAGNDVECTWHGTLENFTMLPLFMS